MSLAVTFAGLEEKGIQSGAEKRRKADSAPWRPQRIEAFDQVEKTATQRGP
jgi:hypothetical protein